MFRLAGILTCGLVLVGCSRNPSQAEAVRELSGHWVLHTERDCTYGPVKSDELRLYPDGRLGQHLTLRDGGKYDSENEHWSFTPPSSVGLESRWDFHFSADAKAPSKESESLIVEFGSEPVIVIDPDSNCFYSKVP